MNEPSRPAPRPIRLLGLASVVCFLVLVGRFWHPVYEFTDFFQLDASNDNLKVPAFRELPVYVYRDTGGYDGLYYAQVALDPSLRDPALPRAMDNFSYRARRILPSALAWLLGAGKPMAVIRVYSIVNVIAWLILAFLLWRVLDVRDGYGWLAWSGVLFSAGALCSVRLALTDLPAAVLVTATIAAAEAQRKRTALGFAALAGLARETSLLVVAGLVKPPWASGKNATRILLAVLPLGLWLVYVRARVGPADAGWGNFAWPLTGYIGKWRAALVPPGENGDPWLAWMTLLALVGLTAQMVFIARRWRLDDRWWRVGAVYVVLLLCLGNAVWEGAPGAATRVLLPLAIAFNVLAQRTRASLTWLIIGNLAVGAGLLAMRDPPKDPREFAWTRHGATAAIARQGDDWYLRERTIRHRWIWASRHGTVELETWPRGSTTIQLHFGLRSLVPRTVILREDGREIWRATAGAALAPETVNVNVKGGRARLEFTTDTPPVPENPSPGGRDLGFAFYDLRLTIPKTLIPDGGAAAH